MATRLPVLPPGLRTGEPQWEQRYRQFEAELGAAIKNSRDKMRVNTMSYLSGD